MNPRVVSVTPIENCKLHLVFANGEKGVFDCSSLLTHGIFAQLGSNGYFNRAYIADGTVAWPDGQDICPDTLYLDAVKESG